MLVDAPSLTGSVGTPIQTSAAVNTSIANNTLNSQTYQYDVQNCVVIDDKDARCAHYQDSVQLDPGGYITYTPSPTMQLTFNTPGVYQNIVSVDVNGTDQTYSNSEGIGSIQIS